MFAQLGRLKGAVAMHEVNILIAGIGGQGVISASHLLAQAVLDMREKVIVGETFGASQREGSVVTNVRIGSEVRGPLIMPGTADYLIAFEPYEAVRCLNYLSSEGVIISNVWTSIPVQYQLMRAYPLLEDVWQILKGKGKALFRLEATKVAVEIAHKYQSRYDLTNVVILGAASVIDGFPINEEPLEGALQARFKPPSLSMNLEAFHVGRTLIQLQRKDWERKE